MNSLPAILCKVTPAASLLGLSLILAGCNSDQPQAEPVISYAHSTGYGESTVSLPQDLRHYQRTPHAFRIRHHAAPPPEAFPGGN